MSASAADAAESTQVGEAAHRETAQLGLWVFLATELMFFGPLFLGYAYGRVSFPAAFAAASRHTDILIGAVNTGVLLTSSLCVALATLQKNRSHAIAFLWIAVGLGAVFLILKGFEYHDEWQEHLVPWLDFHFEPEHFNAAAYFFVLYFAATGLHAVHLAIGIVILGVFALRLRAGPMKHLVPQLELGALYWHFVDSVWVILYPLIYLVGRHG